MLLPLLLLASLASAAPNNKSLPGPVKGDLHINANSDTCLSSSLKFTDHNLVLLLKFHQKCLTLHSEFPTIGAKGYLTSLSEAIVFRTRDYMSITVLPRCLLKKVFTCLLDMTIVATHASDRVDLLKGVVEKPGENVIVLSCKALVDRDDDDRFLVPYELVRALIFMCGLAMVFLALKMFWIKFRIMSKVTSVSMGMK